MPPTPEPTFKWQFQRLGGIDQATLRTADELRNLKDLDPKLWATLSCPATGLEFDHRTLQLVDTDADGRIRIPEVIAAVEFVCAHLKNPEAILEPGDLMPLSLLREDDLECERMHATAHAILEKLEKPDAEGLTQEDVAEAVAKAAENQDNGDGIVPPFETLEPDIQAFIKDAISVIGGVEDATGLTGINREIADAFTGTLEKLRDWKKSVHCAATPLGQDTAEAWLLLQSLKDKIDDYFLRCDLAAFAP
ncbi:ABC transporter permease, partial [Desulfovibrio sp. OttesenSCG-928-G15]|nr:ABC transporter permease [Desulfovibrio sp. OttesenSCG-928-G15]